MGFNKSSTKGRDAKEERQKWKKPAGAHPFANKVRWDFENDVRDVEDGDDGVVVIALHAEVFIETSNFGVSCEQVLDNGYERSH